VEWVGGAANRVKKTVPGDAKKGGLNRFLRKRVASLAGGSKSTTVK